MSPNTRQGQTSCYCRSNQRCHWPSAKSQRLSSRLQQHTFVAWWCGLAVLVTMESHVENRLTGPVQSCLQEFYKGLVNPKLDTDYPNQVCSCRVEIYAMSAIFGRLLRQQNLRPIRFPRGLIKPMTILGLYSMLISRYHHRDSTTMVELAISSWQPLTGNTTWSGGSTKATQLRLESEEKYGDHWWWWWRRGDDK